MKINQELSKAAIQQNNIQNEIKESNKNTNNVAVSGYSFASKGNNVDNHAYRDAKQTMEDILPQGSQKDLKNQQDYMLLVSNTMSGDDFGALLEEGIDPTKIEVDQLVTVVDKMKATLASAGIVIKGYTDTLDTSTLEKITGSVANAQMIAQKLKEADLPVTEQNIEDVDSALKQLSEIESISEDTKKFLVSNQLTPTLENTYKAQFSASDARKQGKGYFAEDFSGYYSKKADDASLESIKDQLKKVIEKAGLEVTKETLDNAEWLVKTGEALTPESIRLADQIDQIEMPQDKEEYLEQIVIALKNGKKANEFNLAGEIDLLDKAIEIKEKVEELDETKLSFLPKELDYAQKKITLKDLFQNNDRVKKDEDTTQIRQEDDNTIALRRQLEEIRLKMSVETNYGLLKRGFSIETKPIEEVVEALKNYEKMPEILDDTMEKVSSIESMPAAIIGFTTYQNKQMTLNAIYEEGTNHIANNKLSFEELTKTYESVMTLPSKEYGDSINKAFQNVDGMLEELHLPLNYYNQRAVRILAYNQIPIDKKAIEEMKMADYELTSILKKMTPTKTLSLIRDGINPLEVDLAKLEEHLTKEDSSKQDSSKQNDAKQYAKFLHELDKKDAISDEEREAYIGIYRLIKQIEKSDGALIGSVLNDNKELTFSNLLSAHRSSKQQNRTVQVDDQFGHITNELNRDNTISQQITNYYTHLAQDLADKIKPNHIEQFALQENVTIEDVREIVESDDAKASDATFWKDEWNAFSSLDSIEEYVIQNLLHFEEPITIENLYAQQRLMNNRGKQYRDLTRESNFLEDETPEHTIKSQVEGSIKEIQNSLEDRDQIMKAFEKVEQTCQDIIDISIDLGKKSVREMKDLSVLYSQMSLQTKLAKKNSYEIPIYHNGKLTSMNVTLKQGDQTGNVVTTMDTQEFGKIVSKFEVSFMEDSYKTNGFVVVENGECNELLTSVINEMKEQMETYHTEFTQISIVNDANINLEKFRNVTSKEQENKEIPNKVLYQIAKSFVISLQNVINNRYTM